MGPECRRKATTAAAAESTACCCLFCVRFWENEMNYVPVKGGGGVLTHSFRVLLCRRIKIRWMVVVTLYWLSSKCSGKWRQWLLHRKNKDDRRQLLFSFLCFCLSCQMAAWRPFDPMSFRWSFGPWVALNSAKRVVSRRQMGERGNPCQYLLSFISPAAEEA